MSSSILVYLGYHDTWHDIGVEPALPPVAHNSYTPLSTLESDHDDNIDTVQQDKYFYMSLVTIQVEDCLFRVPKEPLEQSKIFRDTFSLPVAEDPEGSREDNPIRLDGIKREEFRRFLQVLFMSACEETTSTEPHAVFETWFPVVKLAQMWGFDQVHRYAIKKMPYSQVCKDTAEKVGLAVQYNIEPWLFPGLLELAQRPQPLGNDDLMFLGAELALKVAAVRESFAVGRNGYPISGVRYAPRVGFAPR